jgi:biotin-(acetyl-CoA carboxylase) ligase
VGINVANSIPADLAGTATRLADRLPGVTPDLVEPEVTTRLRALDPVSARLGAAELAGLRHRDWLHGRRLRGPAPGRAAGISEEGALLVRADSGATIAVRAGTVELDDHSLTS